MPGPFLSLLAASPHLSYAATGRLSSDKNCVFLDQPSLAGLANCGLLFARSAILLDSLVYSADVDGQSFS